MRTRSRFQILGLCAVLVGCVGLGEDTERDLTESYSVLKGELLAAPRIESKGSRLVLTLRAEGSEDVQICVTENREHKEILTDLVGHLEGNQAQVILYGKKIEGQLREYVAGVDFYFDAIAFARRDSGEYAVVLTEYGDRLKDLFVGVSWSSFLTSVTRTATKQVF